MTASRKREIRAQITALMDMEKWFALQERTFRLKHAPVMAHVKEELEKLQHSIDVWETRI